MTTDQTAYVEVLARLLCAADVHVHDGDHPTWQQLSVAQHGRGQDDYRKAARWLAERLTVTAETRLSRAERRCEELRAESKRRGKKVLEYSEKNRALEREIDGIQRKLSAEILRADQAEAAVSSVGQAPATEQTALLAAADRIDAADLPQDYVDMFDNGARWATAELRRMAVEAAVPGRTTDETQLPHRGDAVEAWLKAQREAAADYPQAYQAADGLLDLYRLHADTGTPLSEHVCEGRTVGDCDCLETAPAVGGAQQPTEDQP
jgi:hypothetical protein